MSELSMLLLGIGFGLRHAMDADHVVVVAALVERESGMWKTARIAALWGTGHTASFLALGLLIVIFGVRIPHTYEHSTEFLVAATLIGLGTWHLVRRPSAKVDEVPESALTAARPVAIGLIHGLAGSSGIALLAATTFESRSLAVSYLGLVAFGTVLGMVSLTVILSRPIAWMMRGPRLFRRSVTVLAALLSIGLGLSVLVRALGGGGAA